MIQLGDWLFFPPQTIGKLVMVQFFSRIVESTPLFYFLKSFLLNLVVQNGVFVELNGRIKRLIDEKDNFAEMTQ